MITETYRPYSIEINCTVQISELMILLVHVIYPFRYIYVVERAQRNHFTALKRVMELIGYEDLAAKIVHLSYGRVKGLSTR